MSANQGAATLLGRDRELAQLVRAWDDARDGDGSLHLLGGEPGIGKTRLAAEILRLVELDGGTALWGRCRESGGAPVFWPWAQVVRGLAATRTDEQLLAQLGPGAPWLAHLCPELGDRLQQLEGPAADDGARARVALFRALAGFLRAAAVAEPPLAIAIDDVHAADELSLLALGFCARALRGAPVLLLAGHRPSFSGLTRADRRMALAGLGRAEVAALLRDPDGEPPHPSLAAAVHEVTRGNPFFTGEVAQLLAEEGPAAPLPDGPRETIRRRLTPLDADVRELLGLASAIGCEFRLMTLAEAASRPHAEVRALLGEAAALGVVSEAPGNPARYAFAHEMVRETLHAELRGPRRAEAHRRVGEALERLYGDDAEPHLRELAHHFAHAAPAGAAAKGVDYCERAARRARSLLAFEDAAALVDTAERLRGL